MHILFCQPLLHSIGRCGMDCPFGRFVSAVLAVSFLSYLLPTISIVTFGKVWGRCVLVWRDSPNAVPALGSSSQNSGVLEILF